jgi:hypothetical protein
MTDSQLAPFALLYHCNEWQMLAPSQLHALPGSTKWLHCLVSCRTMITYCLRMQRQQQQRMCRCFATCGVGRYFIVCALPNCCSYTIPLTVLLYILPVCYVLQDDERILFAQAEAAVAAALAVLGRGGAPAAAAAAAENAAAEAEAAAVVAAGGGEPQVNESGRVVLSGLNGACVIVGCELTGCLQTLPPDKHSRCVNLQRIDFAWPLLLTFGT